MTTLPFGAQLIGRTEKALNALLDRALAGTGVTEPQWVALTLTVTAAGADPVPRIAQALRVPDAAARERLAELAAAGLTRTAADGTAGPTDAGRALWHDVRAQVAELTDGLWGDLPPADLAVAARVLTTVHGRADALLA